MTVNIGGQRRGRGAEAVAAEENKEEPSNINPSDYSCEVILEKTTKDKANDRKLPSDAFNIFYVVDGEERLDVCRAQKAANIFDLYYDKYKNVKGIEYGSGTIPPNRFGLKPPPKKKGKTVRGK